MSTCIGRGDWGRQVAVSFRNELKTIDDSGLASKSNKERSWSLWRERLTKTWRRTNRIDCCNRLKCASFPGFCRLTIRLDALFLALVQAETRNLLVLVVGALGSSARHGVGMLVLSAVNSLGSGVCSLWRILEYSSSSRKVFSSTRSVRYFEAIIRFIFRA